ncbi:hypothetical protein ASPCAL04956 [Aspergillus calidoustus]|uniref:Uncharacterized protein n=1 Tax=Aspergillus calidoustus TaxID=454130 RepID=A0A0U4Z2C5_ASPCI|nr:hypothetical protein ASPCAL04956 [Aspergillus calidoustus]
MAHSPLYEPVNHEKCSNSTCRFGNIMDALECEKCGTALTGGRSAFHHSHSGANFITHRHIIFEGLSPFGGQHLDGDDGSVKPC